MYTIKLCYYPFSIKDRKSLFFSNNAERNLYFTGLTGYSVNNYNLVIGNGVNLEINNIIINENYLTVLTKYNYAYITSQEDFKVRCYFINEISQLSGNLYNINLELDDIMTNYPSNRNNVYGMVKRAHANRFIYRYGDSYRYNYDENSIFHLNNEINGSPIARERFNPITKNNSMQNGFTPELRAWFENYVDYWVYAFISNGTYVGNGGDIGHGIGIKYYQQEMNSDICCYWFPVYKNGGTIELDLGDSEATSGEALGDCETAFQLNNDDTSRYYSKKISRINPFSKVFTSSYRIIGGNKLIIHTNEPYASSPILEMNPFYGSDDAFVSFFHAGGISITNNYSYMGWGCNQADYEILESSELNTEFLLPKYNFSGSYIKTNSNNLSPIELKPSFTNITMNNGSNGMWEIDISKIYPSTLEFRYCEPLTPDITKTSVRFESSSENIGIYNSEMYSSSQIGLFEDNDDTIPYSNDRYSEYLAQNKNFWKQTALKAAPGIVSGIGMTVGGVVSQNYIMAGMGVASLASSAYSLINTNMSMENMKSSPDAYKTTSGSAFVKLMSQPFQGVQLEVWKAPQIQFENMLTFYKINGYLINLLGYSKDYDNIRRYYNHLEMVIEELNIPISDLEKDRLKERLENITFVSTDAQITGLYTENQNYERNIL